MALKSPCATFMLRALPALALGLAILPAASTSAATASRLSPMHVGRTARQAEATLELSSKTIEMGAFYNGVRLRMQGTVPSGSKVMIVLRGVAKDEAFNQKDRVGPIWINVDKVHVTGPPSLFLRFSSEDVHTFLDRGTIDAYALDELSIRNRMQIRSERGVSDPEALRRIGDHYIDLKKADGSYRRIADRVHVADAGDGQERYTLEFGWPKLAPPGSYQVEVYACRDGQIVGQAGAALQLVEIGFPALMANAAKNHPYGYGVFAVILAVIAGFGIDALGVLLGGAKKRVPAGARPLLRPQPAHRTMAARAGAGGGPPRSQDGGTPITLPAGVPGKADPSTRLGSGMGP